MRWLSMITATTAFWLLSGVVAGQTPPARPCTGPEYEQFDFWVGTWEVRANDKVVGRNVITRIHGGCTLRESYTTKPGGFEGGSFNYYDPTDASWHQVWVDNSGTRLHLKGGFAEGKMVLAGSRLARGQEVVDRITWTANPDGSVRQQWDLSPDDGATWKPLFDGMYFKIADDAEGRPETQEHPE